MVDNASPNPLTLTLTLTLPRCPRMVDNAMMICSGEAIDQTLGLFLGLSTLGAGD